MSEQKKLKLSFCGGTGIVTGANFLLETVAPEPAYKILVDCGMIQGEKLCEEGVCADANRKPFPYDPKTVQILLVTHSHMDHVGRIPLLLKEGFRGIIYSTPETKTLAKIMLADSLHILTKEAVKQGIMPLYEERDVTAAFDHWQTITYHADHNIGGGFSVYLKDAGHVLGSSIYEISYNGKKIAFTGDLGNTPTPLLRDTEYITDADYMVIESVYGDRNHEPKDERDHRFETIVRESIARGGVLVIPAFSLERTQVLLYELNQLIESKKIPSVPVYIDSPLAIKATDVYIEYAQRDFNDAVKKIMIGGDDIFKFPHLHFTETTEESKAILHSPNPKIIMAGSGMSNGGRILHHEKNYLPDPKSTLLLVGYEAAGTLGRMLQDGAKNVVIYGDQVRVAAKVEMISGYSSHKDSDHLVEFVEHATPHIKRVFVAMGEPKASLFLVQRLRDTLNVDAIAPDLGQYYLLEF